MLLYVLFSAILSGRVLDSENGYPVAGATVILEGEDRGTYTDDRGLFVIKDTPERALRLVIRRIGYEDKTMDIGGPSTDILVEVKPTGVLSREIVVTGTAVPHVVGESPVPVQVVSRAKLDAANQTSVPDAMRLLPGLSISGGAPYGASGRFTVMFQGLPAQYTLALLDGKRLLSDHIHTGVNISMIPVLLVERIEVVEGPASALYGSDALGGVINVITTKPSPVPTYAFRSYYGTYGNLEAAGAFGGAGPAGSVYLLSLGQRSFGGKEPGQRYQRLNSSIRSSWKWFSVNGDYLQGDGGLNADGLPTERWWNPILEAKATLMTGESQHEIAGYFNHFYRIYKSGAAQEENFVGEVNLKSHFHLGFNQLSLGGAVRNNYFERIFTPYHSEMIYGVFAEDEVKPAEALGLIAATRLDYYPVGGLQFTPKAGALFKASRWLNIRASVGRGFRAPSLQDRYEELYFHDTFYRNGNPDLKPEVSMNYSGGFEVLPTGFLAMGFSGFYNDVTNMISIAPTGDSLNGLPILERQNIASAYTYGFSVRAQAETRFISGAISYTYLIARNAENDMPLAYEPKHSIGGQLTLEYRNAGLSLTGEWAKDRGYYAEEDEEYKTLPDYTLVNLNLFARPLNGVQVNFGIQNLLDQEYFTYGDEGEAPQGLGRTMGGGINVRF
ncbi:MAG: TonB-dependent receptor [candidate division WOR-3 bacterium]